jgi:hypothetical protein
MMASGRLFAMSVVLLVPTAALAQASSETASGRTSWGAPDLQGVWNFNTSIPLERRPTPAELETFMSSSPPHWRAPDVPPQKTTGHYNSFWSDAPTEQGQQTEHIVDPPDGRIPEILPGVEIQVGSAWADFPGTRPVRYRTGGIGAAGPEDRGLAVRCIVGYNSGPPMMPLGYNANVQLFQTDDYVVILNEMVHNARIVPLDGRAHLPDSLRQWMGDARGRWEGDTLVVETTNFTDKTSSFSPYIARSIGNGANLMLVERFSRPDAQTLRYEYTVTDPSTFSRPFTARIDMARSDVSLFEFACHEGNYGLANILAGARAEERGAR